MRFAYADPPYLGCCRLYDHNHPEGERPFDGRCWDDPETHRLLIDWLGGFDGWALSATSNSLRTLLPMCPEAARVAPWVKPFHAYKKGVRPAYAWEPIIFYGGRQEAVAPPKGGAATTPKDFVIANITLKRGFTGAKPDEVSLAIFDWLGMESADEFVDVFGGSGAVAECHARWVGRSTDEQLDLLAEVQ